LYVGSLGRLFLLSLRAFKRLLATTGFNAVFCVIQAVSSVISGSRAIGGAPVCFHPVPDTDISLDCSEELFLSSLISCKEVLIVTDLNDVFCFVLTVFLIILGSTAAEGAAFSSHLIAGTGVRLDLRRIMLEDRAYGPVPPKNEKKVAKTKYSWHANRELYFTGG
jgi:hypothetical protein